MTLFSGQEEQDKEKSCPELHPILTKADSHVLF